MVWLLRRCQKCYKYTLKTDNCPYCGGPVLAPHPPKFSPADKYLKYRMALKRGVFRNEEDLRKGN